MTNYAKKPVKKKPTWKEDEDRKAWILAGILFFISLAAVGVFLKWAW